MLQQTGVKTVIPYYIKFLKKWPSLNSFFKAELDEILFLWQGLGYYQRAKNLYNAKEYLKKNSISINSESLKNIPGIGDYISSSISAILCNEACPVIDSNVKRVLSRVFDLNNKAKAHLKDLKCIAKKLTPKLNNGDYCQSLMDLASLVCKTTNPLCSSCPVYSLCLNKNKKFSRKRTKISKKKKIGVIFFINFKKLFLVEHSKRRLLEGLYTFPVTEFVQYNSNRNNEIFKKLANKWLKQKKLGDTFQLHSLVEHEFSHFQLKLLIVNIKLKNKTKIDDYIWMSNNEFNKLPVSKLMFKVKEKIL